MKTFEEYWREDFSKSEAISYLKKLDSDLFDSIKKDGTATAKKKYSAKFHPDKNGDAETMKLINQAFDVLGKDFDFDYEGDELHKGIPVWAWAGEKKMKPIVSNTPYYMAKRKAWVLSGKPSWGKGTEYWFGFFENPSFQSSNTIALYSTSQNLKEIVSVYIDYLKKKDNEFSKNQAIFVSKDLTNPKTTVFTFDNGKIGKSFELELKNIFFFNAESNKKLKMYLDDNQDKLT